ncbi:DUF6415 family natural product biosynthesis protein [Streptomyces sp. NPDC102364]|uniref:DUF6415 family natural product biosynthesis protein n=1 Tax=Streptomyces sp. NPDC102364 TaxID=3366161 RepID=UPI0037F2FC1A
MTQPSQHTATGEATRAALIDEATAATGILPPHDRLVDLAAQLRTELRDLIPVVQARADGMNRGTTDWYSCDRALAGARETLEGDLGVGLRSAALHVASLGRFLGVLDAYR